MLAADQRIVGRWEQWPWIEKMRPTSVLRHRESFFVEEHIVLARRARISRTGYLDRGEGLLAREASHRGSHLAYPFGIESFINLWLNRWLLSYTQSWILSRQQTDPIPLSSDVHFRDFVVPHSLWQVGRFYISSLLGHLLCGIAFQPISVLMTIQACQLNHRITPRQAYSLVRSVPQKSLWDGCLARGLHGFAFQTIDDLTYHFLLNLFQLHDVPPQSDDHLWNPRSSHADLHTSLNRCYFRWAARMLISRTSSLLASVATAPLSMVRARLEGQGCSAQIPVRWTSWLSFVESFYDIWRTEGGKTFYRGVEHELCAYAQDVGILALISVGAVGLFTFSLTRSYFEHNRHSLVSRFLRFVLTKPKPLLDDHEELLQV